MIFIDFGKIWSQKKVCCGHRPRRRRPFLAESKKTITKNTNVKKHVSIFFGLSLQKAGIFSRVGSATLIYGIQRPLYSSNVDFLEYSNGSKSCVP